MREVRQVEVDLHSVVERATRCLSHHSQIPEGLMNLHGNALGGVVAHQRHGLWVQGNLTGQPDHLTHPNRLRVGADRRGRAGGGDNFSNRHGFGVQKV